jgi:hypothetical protein
MKKTMKDINSLKDELTKASTKGFGYFMKNVGMVVLIVLAMYVLTNPDIITNPGEFFHNVSKDSLWVVVALFFIVSAFYQLSKSVESEKRKEFKEDRIDDVEEAIKRSDEANKKHHAELVQKRFEVSPLISNELKRLLIALDADRAAILEMHNGTNNASGLPFIYGDMAYEEISPNVGYASDEFKNFNLAKLPFVSLHYNEKTWIGSVDEVGKDDPYFAAKLRVVEVNFGAFVVLEGINGPVGFLTLFFKDEKKHPTKARIIAELNHSSQILSTLLDKIRY